MDAHPNGDTSARPKSAFFQHLLRYPAINDGVTSFKQNDFGQRSLKLSDSAFKTLAPVVPYLSKPYELVSPYVKKADEIGDQALCKVDERFPVVNKPTNELYADAKTMVMMPYRKGIEGKDHVFHLYSAQYQKAGGEGLFTHAKSLVSTVFIVGGQTLTWVGSFWSTKKAEMQETVMDKGNN